ncbi:MAG: TIGR00288 family NYN domain-containing protein [Candidatus Diapherotrites archaeon]|nr:TIGR00288 family NYN domain-containing protein [Candidatus Diapherotrites archaeon]
MSSFRIRCAVSICEVIIIVVEELKHKLGLLKLKKKNIAVLVDGPNILRKEFNINLDELKKKLRKYGKVKVGKVFLDQYAPDKLIEAVTNQGFEPVITSTDVDVAMAAEAMELIYNPHIDVLALMTRDADFQPVLMKAKAHGKEAIVLGVEPGFSTALKNTADEVIIVGTAKE